MKTNPDLCRRYVVIFYYCEGAEIRFLLLPSSKVGSLPVVFSTLPLCHFSALFLGISTLRWPMKLNTLLHLLSSIRYMRSSHFSLLWIKYDPWSIFIACLIVPFFPQSHFLFTITFKTCISHASISSLASLVTNLVCAVDESIGAITDL